MARTKKIKEEEEVLEEGVTLVTPPEWEAQDLIDRRKLRETRWQNQN